MVHQATWRRAVVGAVAGMVLLLGGACMPVTPPILNSPAGTTTTIVLVRHAEREAGADPPLNAEGEQRAEALLAALRDSGVAAIYATDLNRNRQTAQPLADALGLELRTFSELRFVDTPGLANELVNEILRDHAGRTVLIVGNIGSSLFPNSPGINQALFERLGGDGTAPTRYQDLYIAIVPEEGPTQFIYTTYGGVSSLDP